MLKFFSKKLWSKVSKALNQIKIKLGAIQFPCLMVFGSVLGVCGLIQFNYVDDVWFSYGIGLQLFITAFAWVLNRETPLTDTLGAVKLDNQGSLTLVNGSGRVISSSNSLASGANINLVAQLLVTGNLVIKNGNETLIW